MCVSLIYRDASLCIRIKFISSTRFGIWQIYTKNTTRIHSNTTSRVMFEPSDTSLSDLSIQTGS